TSAPVFSLVSRRPPASLSCHFQLCLYLIVCVSCVSIMLERHSLISQFIFYLSNGKEYPGLAEFKDRVQFIGDINKRDVSIQLSPAQFSDNGTFFCDVKNPPDVMGTPARMELRVVLKESLPASNTAIIVGAVCGALFLLVLVAVAACIVMRVLHSRHEYEG
uniref:Immunoglobulin V-set domain-containing protein n=1 Tax=Labrus bergylta TaxID=56723 RepID=A0A3Q3FUQ3_9LABR